MTNEIFSSSNFELFLPTQKGYSLRATIGLKSAVLSDYNTMSDSDISDRSEKLSFASCGVASVARHHRVVKGESSHKNKECHQPYLVVQPASCQPVQQLVVHECQPLIARRMIGTKIDNKNCQAQESGDAIHKT